MQVAEPYRVTRSYVQRIQAQPDQVFPLLCPVRETEWVAGWDPMVVYSRSGLVEPECIFLTGDDQPDSVWVVTRHDRERHILEIVKVTPWTTVANISIALTPNVQQGTDAAISYTYTALGVEGKSFVDHYTEDYFIEFMQHWEAALNTHFRSQEG